VYYSLPVTTNTIQWIGRKRKETGAMDTLDLPSYTFFRLVSAQDPGPKLAAFSAISNAPFKF
jgi:hypothetical protein